MYPERFSKWIFEKELKDYVIDFMYVILNLFLSIFILMWGLLLNRMMFRFPAHIILALTVVYPVLFLVVMVLQSTIYGMLCYFCAGTDFVSALFVVFITLVCSMFGNWLKFGSIDAEMFSRFFSVTTLYGGQ